MEVLLPTFFFCGTLNEARGNERSPFRETPSRIQGTASVWVAKLRAACLQNETDPERFLNQYENWSLKNAKEDPKNDPKRVSENFLALSGRLKIDSHWHFSTNFKSFSPPKICTKKCFLSPRGSAGVATLTKLWSSDSTGKKNLGVFRKHCGWHLSESAESKWP